MKIKNHRQHWLLATWISLTCWLQGGMAWANVGLSETAPPAIISQLATAASGAPQVLVMSPRPEEVVNTNNVLVNFQVQGVPIFKNAALGLGPHLQVLLDRTPYQSVYDLAQPLTLTNLTPGTHTLQVLLAKPWHESWKNPGAMAQVTFHVFAKSAESPVATVPTLVYNEPDASYGAEPFLLDFYVANAPSHLDTHQHPINDWRVRVTINDQSFEIDRLPPFYLKGLKPGANLVKLEYLNAQDQSLDSILRVVNYQPNGTDGLSRLLRNEISLPEAVALFDPVSKNTLALNPVAVAPVVVAVPPPSPLPSIAPAPVALAPMPAPVILPPLPLPTVMSEPLVLHPQLSVTIPQPDKQVVPVPPANVPIANIPSVQPAFPAVAAAPVFKVPAFKNPLIEKPVAITESTSSAIAAGASKVNIPTLPTTSAPILTPATGENVIEFKVLAREFWHTLSVRIKKFTNSIPPTVAQWSKDLGRWISDRAQAMRSSPKAAVQQQNS
jgi:hypothetical protein